MTLLKILKTAAVATLAMLMMSGCVSSKTSPLTENQRLVEKIRKADVHAVEDSRGVVVYIPDLYFEFGSTKITEKAKVKIKYVSEVAKEQFVSGRSISIEGHTDSIGTEEYNMDLSERRAQSVWSEMAGNGVEQNRMKVTGFGESRPRLPNTLSDGSDNPEGRETNRRVEMIFLNP